MAQLFSLIIILFTTSSFSKEAVKCLTSSQLIIYNPESDKNSQECMWGREGERIILFISSSFSPQISVCISHTPTNAKSHFYPMQSPLPAMDTPHGQDALTRTEPPKAPSSHLSPLSAEGKSQCHLCFSGSEAFLVISVHLGHSLSQLIVLFFYSLFVF